MHGSILIKGIIDRKVSLIIIDEFPAHLQREGSASANEIEITDLLKEIIDKTKVPLIVLGTDELGDLNSLDSQFTSRHRVWSYSRICKKRRLERISAGI